LFFFSSRCTLSNQSEKLHYEETVQAYTNAKNEYLRLHPEAHDMVLRYDPISHLTKPSTSAT
jgi:transcriptional antiterminator Rof (Rho-off)